MTIYILMYTRFYEGSDYVGAFSTVEKAKQCVEKMERKTKFEWEKMGNDWRAPIRNGFYEITRSEIDA